MYPGCIPNMAKLSGFAKVLLYSFYFIMRRRVSEREDTAKQNENSTFQEHVAEASLIFAGASRERWGKSRCMFFCAPRNWSISPGAMVSAG